MKAIRNVLVLTTLCVIASAQSNSNSPTEPRFFNIEDSIPHQAQLSDAELSVLGNDDLLRGKLPADHAAPTVTQEGLEAAEVHLCGSGERDLIVMGNGEAFVGANVGPFWIIRNLPTGPVIVLSETSLGLTIDTKRSNKCLNVEATTAMVGEVATTEFHFDGAKYIASRQKSEKVPQ